MVIEMESRKVLHDSKLKSVLRDLQAGTFRIVRFTGALTLTHNASNLILPSAANITTEANDTAGFVSLGLGNWKCVWYQRYSGASLAGISAATQAEQETATSTTVTVTPGRQQYHPSAAKVWAIFDGRTTGTNAPTAGYNVTSVTRNSTGNYTINLTTAFSSANYVVMVTQKVNESDSIGVSALAAAASNPAAGSFGVITSDINGSRIDSFQVHVVAFGDQ